MTTIRNSIQQESDGIKPRVKIIVIACNTATAMAERYNLAAGAEQHRCQGIGVINAGVKATLDQLNVTESDEPFAIGVLATPGTIASAHISVQSKRC